MLIVYICFICDRPYFKHMPPLPPPMGVPHVCLCKYFLDKFSTRLKCQLSYITHGIFQIYRIKMSYILFTMLYNCYYLICYL